MKLQRPGQHRYGNGWMLGTVNGREWFSDGNAMFLLQEKAPETNCQLPQGHMQSAYNQCVPKKRMPSTRVTRRIAAEGLRPALVVLRGGVAIQEQYFDYLRKHYQCRIALGKKTSDRAYRVICGIQKDGTVVAVIMPFRYS